jgi:site-specific DNA-methyltransferase (adenine-specific)
MMSSATPEWATPRDLFDALDAEFHFDIDVCATKHNAKCLRYWTKEHNALTKEWGCRLTYWMNPPYGREIGTWMERAYRASLNGSTVVCLVPSRTDTAWWWDYAMKGEIRFIRGRVKFVRDDGKCDSAPFPSAVVVFRPDPLYLSGIELIKTFGHIPNP